jgi:hypothetical protein
VKIMAGQVLTSASRFEDGYTVSGQGFSPLSKAVARSLLKFVVHQGIIAEAEEGQPPALREPSGEPAPPAAGARRKSTKSKKPRKSRKPKHGGWPETRCLRHDQFKQARADAFSLHHMGYRWTVAVSLMPPAHLVDAAKQRWITKKLANLGQELERHGLLDIRMAALEKKRHGGKLHGHALVSIPAEHFRIVDKWANDFDMKPKKKASTGSVEIYACAIENVRGAILYMLKKHAFAGKFEKSRRGPWLKAGDPIKGQRVSQSKAALAILNAAAERRANRRAQIMQPVERPLPPIQTSPEITPVSSSPLATPLTISPPQEQQPVEVSAQVSAPAPIDLAALVEASPLQVAPRRKRVPVKRAKHLPPSLPMDYPPTADELMLRLGQTKQAIGDALGLSRQQANNVIVRRFDTSKQVVRKVLEMALAA